MTLFFFISIGSGTVFLAKNNFIGFHRNIMITFKANYIDRAFCPRIVENNTSAEVKPVNFVRINPTDDSDILSLYNTKIEWGGRSYVPDIYERALGLYYEKNDSKDKEIYALTEQEADFSKLDPKKILALSLVETRSKFSKYISFLQVNPKYISHNSYNKNTELRKVGSTMLDCIKSRFEQFSLILHASKNNFDFYLKNGFKIINKESYYMSFLRKTMR